MTDEEALSKVRGAFDNAKRLAGEGASESQIHQEVRARRKNDPELFEALKHVGLLMQLAQQGH